MIVVGLMLMLILRGLRLPHLDAQMTPQGLVLVALDGLQKLENGAWASFDPGVPGDPRAAALDNSGRLR